MEVLQRRKRWFRVLLFFDLLTVLLLVTQAFYRSSAIADAQDALARLTSTPLADLTCEEVCPAAFPTPEDQDCCGEGGCRGKADCEAEAESALEETISSDQHWLTVVFCLMGFFVLNMWLIVCLSRSVERRQLRQQQALRRHLLARLLFLAERQADEEQHERERRLSLLTESLISGDPQETCAVCLDAFGEEPVVGLACEHAFHRECIESWMASKSTCPVCRAEQ